MKAVLAPACAEHYEALRQNAVAREPVFSPEPLGAVLVVKNGVAGWMRRWGEICGPTAPAAPRPLSYPHADDAAGWHHELAVLLAEMTAPHLRSISS